jgi:formylmethanofuran dehydrogenase subunit E
MQLPEITWAERTGYPSWNQPGDICCDECGEVIEDEVYEDEHNENLCLDCLLKLHLKEVVN